LLKPQLSLPAGRPRPDALRIGTGRGANFSVALMLILDLFPCGVMQLRDSIANGYRHARRLTFLMSGLHHKREWLRAAHHVQHSVFVERCTFVERSTDVKRAAMARRMQRDSRGLARSPVRIEVRPDASLAVRIGRRFRSTPIR
jgi:hypothetical protein